MKFRAPGSLFPIINAGAYPAVIVAVQEFENV